MSSERRKVALPNRLLGQVVCLHQVEVLKGAPQTSRYKDPLPTLSQNAGLDAVLRLALAKPRRVSQTFLFRLSLIMPPLAPLHSDHAGARSRCEHAGGAAQQQCPRRRHHREMGAGSARMGLPRSMRRRGSAVLCDRSERLAALRRRGIAVAVFEQASGADKLTVGAGINLMQPAVAVMKVLAASGWVVRHRVDTREPSRSLSRFPAGLVAGYGGGRGTSEGGGRGKWVRG